MDEKQLVPKKSKLFDKRSQTKKAISDTTYITVGGRYKVDKKTIGTGVSSVVMAGVHLKSGRRVAVKKIIKFFENKHESLRVLRQIILLRVLEHPNIVHLHEIIIEKQELYLILQYFPSDIKKVFRSNRQLQDDQIIQIIFQILCGLRYCDQCQVLHRDLKPENILITDDLSEVKLCDFGLARAVVNDRGEQKKSQEKKNTPNVYLSAHVTTRWYRAPQLIILERQYTSAIDMWSLGCLFGQLLSMHKLNANSFMNRKTLFPGKGCYPLSPPVAQVNYQKINNFPHSISDQLSVIFDILGTPQDISFISDERSKKYIQSFGKIKKKPFHQIYDHLPKYAQDFLQKALMFNPQKRLTIEQAVKHSLFDNIRVKYEQNLSVRGLPINMELQQLTIEQIRQLAYKQAEYYKNKFNEEEVQ